MDEDGVEELVGEAEVVLLEPRNDGVGEASGRRSGAEGLEKRVPEGRGNGAVRLGELELGAIERGRRRRAGVRVGVRRAYGIGEEVEEGSEVVATALEGENVVVVAAAAAVAVASDFQSS